MPIDYEALGKRVKERRVINKLSQEELATRIGVSIQHVSNIENNRTKISLEKLVDLANELNVTVDFLLCDSVTAARPVLEQEISRILEKETEAELRMIPELLRELHYYKKIILSGKDQE